MHGAQKSRVGNLGRHRVDNAVHRFVAADAQDRRAENFLALGIDDDFHQTVGFAFFDCAAHLRHGALADADFAPDGSGMGFRQADTAQRRIDEQPVAGNSIADPPRIAVE